MVVKKSRLMHGDFHRGRDWGEWAGMRGSRYAVGMLLYVLGMMRCMDDKKVLFPFSLPPPSDFSRLASLYGSAVFS